MRGDTLAPSPLPSRVQPMSCPVGDAQARTLSQPGLGAAPSWPPPRVSQKAPPLPPHSHSPTSPFCILARMPRPKPSPRSTRRTRWTSTQASLGAHGPGIIGQTRTPEGRDRGLHLPARLSESLRSAKPAALLRPPGGRAQPPRPLLPGGRFLAAARRDAEYVCAARPIFTPQTK